RARAQEHAAADATERTLAALPRSRYLLLPPLPAGAEDAACGLLVVLPGGTGSADFLPFVRDGVHAQLPAFCCAMVVAPKWTADQQIVWPTARSKVAGMRYTTEEYVRAVVADVRRAHTIDDRRVLLLAWSSSGPAAYATLLGENSPFRG